MSVGYKSVQWNRQKLIYDAILLGSVGMYLWIFMTVAAQFEPSLDLRGIRIRAFGSAAFILLHVILSIGPLTRLTPKLYPLLFNRRHMGVTMFLLAAYHFRIALTWYHDFGNLDPLVSLFVGNTHYADFIRFPFEILGFLSLVILFLMAATSHDFWLANLTAPVWKALHMGVYAAYGLLVGHVVLGALETNKHPLMTGLVGLGGLWLISLHLITGVCEAGRDREVPHSATEDFVDVGRLSEISENRAKVVTLAGERVAIFKYDGKVAAISNVCQHQNGPLGEGKVIDGCITCPWHGYQYRPEDGASPPPFTEKVPIFEVKLQGDQIWVKTTPYPPGTPVAPAVIR
ncbi:MAG: Rieske 2Fe-2S domain-containing protein [Cyanobacteria bacterium J06638_20]